MPFTSSRAAYLGSISAVQPADSELPSAVNGVKINASSQKLTSKLLFLARPSAGLFVAA
ncbi:hypothetical protein ACNJYG_06750 [Pseudomonas sp. GW6]